MQLDLANRQALVTGAGNGIGMGIAKILAKEGVKLVLSARTPTGVNSVADAIKATGLPRPEVVIADLTQESDINDLIKFMNKESVNADILVNCAGGSRPFTLDTPDHDWEEAIMLNFTSCRLLTQRLISGMIARQWGRVINLSGAMEPRNLNGANIAKGALHLWSKGLSCDVAKFGVTVNCIAPGRINSEQILNKLHPTEASRQAFIKQNIPAGKFGEPEDVGNLVAFLCSPLAHYITGTVIPVDGGMHYFAH